MNLSVFFGPHVCGQDCDGARGCIEARKELGRVARVQRAKAYCAVCPVRDECLDYALDHRIEHGVWGGYTERERRALRKGMINGTQQAG